MWTYQDIQYYMGEYYDFTPLAEDPRVIADPELHFAFNLYRHARAALLSLVEQRVVSEITEDEE